MNAIVAANSDWGISLGGVQVIVIPEDRRHFKALTDGGVVIVGRKTFEKLSGPLPNRKNIVLTRDTSYMASGVTVAHSINEVLTEIACDDPDRVFVIGGGEIYRLFLPFYAYAYVTRIDIVHPSDVFFPDLDSLPGWSLERREIKVWNPEFGIDRKTESGIQDCVAFNNGENNGTRFSFDLYRNNAVEDINV